MFRGVTTWERSSWRIKSRGASAEHEAERVHR